MKNKGTPEHDTAVTVLLGKFMSETVADKYPILSTFLEYDFLVRTYLKTEYAAKNIPERI